MRAKGRRSAVICAGLLLAALFLAAFLIRRQAAQDDARRKEERKTIAVSTIGPTHAWVGSVMYYAEEKLKEVAEENGWDYVFRAADNSYEQSQQLVELVEQEVDCIIMLPMDGASLKTAAVTVQAAGIPLIIFDREIPEFAPTATVKGDNRGIGVETARFFNNYFPDGTTVLELMGDTSTVPFLRTDGFDNTIHDSFTKIQVGYTEWQRAYTRKLFEEWVGQQEQETLDAVGAIFTHDDEIALGVLDVLDSYREQGILERMFPNLEVIAGSSASKEMYARIAEEENFTLFSMTYVPQMMERAVETGAAVLKGEDYNEMTIIPTVLVNRNNVEEYVNMNLPF